MWYNVRASKILETEKAVFIGLTDYEDDFKCDLGVWISKKCFRSNDYYGDSAGLNEDFEYTLIPFCKEDKFMENLRLGCAKYELFNKDDSRWSDLGGRVISGKDLKNMDSLQVITYNKKA